MGTEKKTSPNVESRLRHILRMPQEVYSASGIVVNGRRLKSFVFTTDLAIIRNCDADAVFAVYPFTPQQAISHAIIQASYIPVFCGVGGGTTKGMRTLQLAQDVEGQGAMGVVLNSPISDLNLLAVSRVVDIPVIITVTKADTDIQARLDAGASILNVACSTETPQVVRRIREQFPDIPIIASGGKTGESIAETIAAGANAITGDFSLQSAGFLIENGKKTTHVVYGEAMAILAGDALLNYAYETAARAFALEPGHERIGKAFRILTAKTGIYGMLGGQCVDVEYEGKNLERERLDFIYRLKTSALIEASMMVGAVLAGASDEKIALLERVAGKVGLAFQIQDDILDVTSDIETLGKPIGSDEKNHKTTYVTIRGLEQAQKDVEEISQRALDGLASLKEQNSYLNELVVYLVHRKK